MGSPSVFLSVDFRVLVAISIQMVFLGMPIMWHACRRHFGPILLDADNRLICSLNLSEQLPQSFPQLAANALSPPKGNGHLSRRRSNPQIAIFHSVSRQRNQNTPQGSERAVVRQEQLDQILQIMSLWHDRALFLQQRLQIFFRRLLAMKAHRVPQRRRPRRELACGLPILLGL